MGSKKKGPRCKLVYTFGNTKEELRDGDLCAEWGGSESIRGLGSTGEWRRLETAVESRSVSWSERCENTTTVWFHVGLVTLKYSGSDLPDGETSLVVFCCLVQARKQHRSVRLRLRFSHIGEEKMSPTCLRDWVSGDEPAAGLFCGSPAREN